MTHLIGGIGRWALAQLTAVLQVSVLMVETVFWLLVAPFKGRGFRWRSSVEHFVEYGVRSLPIVGMICFLIGVIIALQASYTLAQWGANRYIAETMVNGKGSDFPDRISGNDCNDLSASVGFDCFANGGGK